MKWIFSNLIAWLQNISPILNQRLSFFCKLKKNCKRNTLSRSTGKLTADVVYRAKAWGLAIKQFDSNHFFFSKKDEIIKISCNRQPNSIKSKKILKCQLNRFRYNLIKNPERYFKNLNKYYKIY